MDLSPGQSHSHSSFLPDPSDLLFLLTGVSSPQVLLCASGSPLKKAKEAEERKRQPRMPGSQQGKKSPMSMGQQLLHRGELLRTLTESQAGLQAEGWQTGGGRMVLEATRPCAH